VQGFRGGEFDVRSEEDHVARLFFKHVTFLCFSLLFNTDKPAVFLLHQTSVPQKYTDEEKEQLIPRQIVFFVFFCRPLKCLKHP